MHKFYLGDYVMVMNQGLCRIVGAKDLDNKYLMLVKGGGAVTISGDKIIKTTKPEFLNNMFEGHYFRDRDIIKKEGER